MLNSPYYYYPKRSEWHWQINCFVRSCSLLNCSYTPSSQNRFVNSINWNVVGTKFNEFYVQMTLLSCFSANEVVNTLILNELYVVYHKAFCITSPILVRFVHTVYRSNCLLIVFKWNTIWLNYQIKFTKWTNNKCNRNNLNSLIVKHFIY